MRSEHTGPIRAIVEMFLSPNYLPAPLQNQRANGTSREAEGRAATPNKGTKNGQAKRKKFDHFKKNIVIIFLFSSALTRTT